MCLLLFLVFLCRFAVTHAKVFPLDSSTPYVRSNGIAVRWSEGWDALTVSSSLCVRLNERGIYSIPAHWSMRDLEMIPGWKTFTCLPKKGSLCGMPQQRSALFPYERQPRYNGSASILPSTPGCTRTERNDGRVLTPSYMATYDLSSCDIFDQGGDLVLCQRTAAFRSTSLSVYVYWILCLTSVYIIRSFSYLVAQRLETTTQSRDISSSFYLWYLDQDTLTVWACVLSVFLVLIPDGDSLYVTLEEQIFLVCMCVYVVMYLFVFFLAGGNKLVDPPIYNLIAATLQLIAARLYTGVQTPYNPVLIWAISARSFVKFTRKKTQCEVSVCEQVTLFADSMLLSLLCVLSFNDAPCYLVSIMTTAFVAADLFPMGN